MASAVHGRALSIVVVAQLASGCCFSFTRAVWGDEEEAKPRAVVWVGSETHSEFQVSVALVEDGEPGADAVALVAWTEDGSDRDGATTWKLKSREGGELLLDLLRPSAPIHEVALAIDAVSDREYGDPAWASAAIEVRGRVQLGAFGERVERDSLVAPTREALAAAEAMRRDAFAEAVADRSFARRSAQQAGEIDPRLLAGAGPGWVVFDSLLLDAEGRPWPPRAEEATWSLAEERAALAEARIALLATNETESAVWLVPADLAVIGGRLKVDDRGGFVHRSQWSFAAIPHRPSLPSFGGTGWTWPMRLVERDLVRGLKRDDRSLGAKLALTPPALLLDLLFGWLIYPWNGALCGRDDDDDERKR